MLCDSVTQSQRMRFSIHTSGGFEASAAHDHCLGLFATAIAMARPWVERMTGNTSIGSRSLPIADALEIYGSRRLMLLTETPSKKRSALQKKAKEAVEVLREELGDLGRRMQSLR
jgi:hypothetical protein